MADLEVELEIFRKKNYGEWDMFTGRVPLEDNPEQRFLIDNGFKPGDKVTFYDEKEREGIIRQNDKGELTIHDTQGNPWGIAGILGSEKGNYIKKS